MIDSLLATRYLPNREKGGLFFLSTGHSPRTILEEFSRIHAADIVLPLKDILQRELRIRWVVRPDREQAILLEHLGLTLPKRLRSPTMPQM